jgi:hypothetical protein
MKQCPKCQRTYADDNQKFCTVDGGRLEKFDDEETLYNLGPTVITNQADLNMPPSEPTIDLNKTMASLPSPPTGEIRSGETGPATNRTIAASFQPANVPSPKQPPAPPPAPQQPPQPYQPPPYQQQPPAYQQQPPYQQPYQQPPQQQPAPSSGQSPHASMPLPHQGGHAQQPGMHAASPAAARKGSRLPLILGAVLLLLVAGGAAYYFLVLNKKDNAAANANSNANVASANANANSNANASAITNTNANTIANANVAPPYEPPPNTTQFVNSSAKLDGKLAEHYTDFSFYYPNSWQLDPKSGVAGAGNFVMVERKLPPDFTQERVAVGWYESNGTYDSDKSLFPALVQATSSRLEKLPGYEKLSEGPTKVNSMNAYEFSFKGLSQNTDKGDITFWGRIIFLPPGVEGRKNGVTLTILTSSLAPELQGIDDVGVKGELPVILESFRLK